MHIPDGFLDLSIASVMYVGAGIFWVFAFRRTKVVLSDRLVPLMATLTALFFAAQIMNYPIIGGTTAHLLGGPILGITLGPYAGMISMTVIVLIQALFFGDGGLTTFGANVWNMGVVGVFIPYLVVLLVLKFRKDTGSLLVGAFVGAFLGDLLAAVFAGFELGLSTLSFPYSVPIAVAAMAINHSIIGVGEGIVTASILGLLLRIRPDLLNLPKAAPTWMGGFPVIRSQTEGQP
ncbi:MAG: energy-coupling factor ABC transporter permease [Aigarchaeota archaeon]|nr:energy-coupling factor ABC transporter permease [Aigarchaeota archaeon]MDH5702586.1 energy-coupling factor ABC transporter permease [Aigarchaeota archaeon]